MQRYDYGATGPAAPSKAAVASSVGHWVAGGTIVTVCLLVPWAIFTVNLALLSFSTHYSHPTFCWFFIELDACFVALCGVRAYYMYQKHRNGDLRREWWHLFFFLTAAIGWLLGIACGLANYSSHMQHFYDITSLALYPSVDPAKSNGQQLLDAGRIIFTKDSHLDFEKAFTFKSTDVYCVAPVVGSEPGQRLATYDFWAVGTNCCQGQGDFKCGQALNPLAHAGTRLLDEGQAANYRLAVQQAEAMYGLRAGHPIFLEWEMDPINQMSFLQDQGLKFFLSATLTHFGMQLFVVVLAAGSSRLRTATLLK